MALGGTLSIVLRNELVALAKVNGTSTISTPRLPNKSRNPFFQGVSLGHYKLL
jgi:hypothetical protein